jgi:hypothetical protein
MWSVATMVLSVLVKLPIPQPIGKLGNGTLLWISPEIGNSGILDLKFPATTASEIERCEILQKRIQDLLVE